jgi:starvation-inducible outer membrane lipoprotein
MKLPKLLNRTKVNVCTFLLMSFMLGACVSMPTENQDPNKNNRATYRKDLRECQEAYPESGSGVHLRQWVGCMQLKGWR